MIQLFCGYTGLINFVTCLSLAVFLYCKNRSGRINKLFAIWSGSVAFWSLGYFLWLFTENRESALFWTRFLMAGAILIPSVYLHFALVFLNQSKSHKPLIAFCYLFSAIYLALDFTPFFILTVEPRYWFRWWPVPGKLYHLYQAFFILAVLYSHVLLFNRVRTEKNYVLKKQYWIVAVGTTIAYLGGSTNFFLWYNIPIPPVFNLLVSLYVAFIAYAIAKYRLMDIRVALTRTTIFISLYVFIFGLPLLMVVWGRGLLTRQFGSLWWTIPVGVYSVFATAGPFLYLLLQRKAEDRLLRDQRRYQQTLVQASRGMTLIKDIAKLLRLIVHMLTRTMRIQFAAIYLLDRESGLYESKSERGRTLPSPMRVFSNDSAFIQYLIAIKKPILFEEARLRLSAHGDPYHAQIPALMEKLEAAVIIPSFVQNQMIGFVVLGEKLSREGYSEDDVNTLTTLANQAALAIENCRFIDQIERTQTQLFQTAKMTDLGTMASGIGHQMNNRLNLIRIGAEMGIQVYVKKIRMAIDYEKYDEARKACDETEASLRTMAESAARGGEIVKRILDYARASEGFLPVSLSEVIDTSVKLLECKRDITKIDFENKVFDIVPKVHGNFAQLEEILFNLIDNAFDAILLKEEAWELGQLLRPENPEKGKIVVTAAPVEEGGTKYLEVKVSDNGLGMTKETQKKLFVPFFTTKATSIKGTGLGLFVIDFMMKNHNGTLSIDSEYGKGTTFRILLPLAEVATKENTA